MAQGVFNAISVCCVAKMRLRDAAFHLFPTAKLNNYNAVYTCIEITYISKKMFNIKHCPLKKMI